ncbi:MAG: hypothetical protein Q4F65_06915 [Propionibacteriaceae bacterium]|nr:hypothetical protein [Propionibacteriaceae bacterium]
MVDQWLDAVTILDVIAVVAVVSTFVTFLVKVGAPLVRLSRAVHDFIDDWRGRAEVRDAAGNVIEVATSSIPARLARIEHEVSPNHGSSAHDQLMKAIGELAGEFNAFREESTADRRGLHKRIDALGPPHNID